MRASRRQVIPTLTIICFGRILGCDQVVADRDYRKQNCDQNCNSNDLTAPALIQAATDSEPQDHKRNGQNCPREIKKNLHARFRSYPTSGLSKLFISFQNSLTNINTAHSDITEL